MPVWLAVLAAGLTWSAEPPLDAWYEASIVCAQAACERAKGRLEAAQALEHRARELAVKAPPGDGAGRAVAEQARAKAAQAAAKDRFGVARDCGGVEQLRRARTAREGGAALILHARGAVTLMTHKGAVRWDGKAPLRPGQKIQTGKDGYAELAFPGQDGRVAVYPNSQFELGADETPKLKLGNFTFNRAAIMDRLKFSAGKEPSLELTDRELTASVRGTRFAVHALPQGSGRLALFEGEVALKEPGVKGKEVVAHGGEAVSFKEGRIAGPPAKLAQAEPSAARGGKP